MKFLAMIQARCSSHRLPSKVMKDLCGKTVLERVVERVQRSEYVDETMVVTSLNEDDMQIVKLMSGCGVRVFAGSLDDVLDRYYQAAKILKPEYVIRITADCPVIDHKIIDEAIEALKEDTQYLGMMTESFPDGLDVEIVKFEALKDAWKNSKLKSEREHVTLYIKNNKNLFKTQNFECKAGNLHDERWTVDEKEDYEFIKRIYEHFYSIDKYDFDMYDILGFIKENPEIYEINRGFIRNEGLIISQKNDGIAENGDI